MECRKEIENILYVLQTNNENEDSEDFLKNISIFPNTSEALKPDEEHFTIF